jgi:3-hydroxyisobutyrate dehydrogenase-like beta-hydroxyacid dehydrogenase
VERIGFIGLGRMGSRMAGRLLSAGYALTVYDAAPGQTESVSGASVASNPREVAERSEAVFTMVTDGPAVLSLLDGWPSGLLHIDTSTIGVVDSARVAERGAALGLRYVRSPVLGTLEAAAAGALVALVSGPRPAVDAALPLLAHLSRQQRYLGQAEEARLVKLITNGVLGSALAAFAEGVALAERAGIDRATVLDILANGANASPALKGSIEKVRESSFDQPRLTTALLAKDLRLLAEAAATCGAIVPVANTAHELYQSASNMGLADQDSSAVLLLLEKLAGVASQP